MQAYLVLCIELSYLLFSVVVFLYFQVQVALCETAPVAPQHQHEFILHPNTVGMGKKVRKRLSLPSASPANPDSQLRQMTPQPWLPRPVRPILPRPAMVPQLPVAEPQLLVAEVAKSTQWYRQQREKRRTAGEYVKLYSRRRTTFTYTCSKCGQSRTRANSHRQYFGHWYCPSTASQTFEEWRSSREKCRLMKKQQKVLQEFEQMEQQQQQTSDLD